MPEAAAGVAGADVIIVGAGPAGASLATRLGQAGLRVLLLDRARFPRDAVCGEALSPGAHALLVELGVAEAVRAAGAHPYYGLRLVAADGQVAAARYPGGAHGLSLPRHTLDALLAERARGTPGVSLREGAQVVDVLRTPAGCSGVALADGTRLAARVVVAADGRRSRTRTAYFDEPPPPAARRFCFLTTFTGAAGEHGLGEHGPGEQGLGEDDLMECGLAAPGLQYVRVCQGPGRFALGLVVDDATRLATQAGTPAGFARLVASLPRLAAALAGGVPGPLRGMALAPYGPPRLVDDGFLVLGDAAGYLDPITGEGMYRAMSGAAIAADVLAKALAAGEGPAPRAALAPYEAALRRQFDPVVRFVDAAVWLTTLPAAASGVFVRAMAALPVVAEAVVAVQGALRPPASLWHPATYLHGGPTPHPHQPSQPAGR